MRCLSEWQWQYSILRLFWDCKSQISSYFVYSKLFNFSFLTNLKVEVILLHSNMCENIFNCILDYFLIFVLLFLLPYAIFPGDFHSVVPVPYVCKRCINPLGGCHIP